MSEFVNPKVAKLGRLPLLGLAALALLAGIDGGLVLVGHGAPVYSERLQDAHGVLMVFGFVGTLIAAERAVALRARWGFAAPMLLGLGAVVTLTAAPLAVGGWLFTAGFAALLGVYWALWHRQVSDELAVQALGAALGGGGALLWAMGVPVWGLLPWLVGFVVLTIGGERAELSRLESATIARHTLRMSGLVCVAVVAATLWPNLGTALLGAALLAFTVVLVTHDAARRTVHGMGLPRFSAACMLAGYVWLAVAGGAWLVGGLAEGGAYDAVIHAVFLGFTISMIFGHAPVILPAVLGVDLPYRAAMWGPLALLHVALVLRLLLGDAYGIEWARVTGAILGAVALLVFIAIAATSAVAAARARAAAARATADGTRELRDGAASRDTASARDSREQRASTGAPS